MSLTRLYLPSKSIMNVCLHSFVQSSSLKWMEITLLHIWNVRPRKPLCSLPYQGYVNCPLLFKKPKKSAHFNLRCGLNSVQGGEAALQQSVLKGATDPCSHDVLCFRDHRVFSILLLSSSFRSLLENKKNSNWEKTKWCLNAKLLVYEINFTYLRPVTVHKVWHWCNQIYTSYRNITVFLAVCWWFDSLAELL